MEARHREDCRLATIMRLRAAARELDADSELAHLHRQLRIAIRRLTEAGKLLRSPDTSSSTMPLRLSRVDDRFIAQMMDRLNAIRVMVDAERTRPALQRPVRRPRRWSIDTAEPLLGPVTDAVLRRNAEAMGTAGRYAQWLRCGGKQHPVHSLPTLGAAGRRYCPRCWTSFDGPHATDGSVDADVQEAE